MLRSSSSRAAAKVTLEELEERFPSVSRSECQRFLFSFPKTASDRLQACVEFRQRHGLLDTASAVGGVSSVAAVNSQGCGDEEAQQGNGNHQAHQLHEQHEAQPHCQSSNDEEGDADDWRRASDSALAQHVRESVAASAALRSGGGLRSARRRLLAAVGVSGGGTADNNGHRNRRARRDRQASPMYATGIPQLLYSHTASAHLGEQSENAIDDAWADSRLPIRDTTDHCILHFLPALIDLAAFDDPSASPHSSTSSQGATPTCRATHTFATALALYLHAKFDQQQQRRWHGPAKPDPSRVDSDPQWTLVMDVRPGHGWPNPPAVKMLGFIREAGQMLFELFPGRLHRCVVFPVPAVAASVWNAAKKVLDPTIASRVVVVSGPAEMDSPVPVAKLLPYVSRENLQIMEEARLAAFAC